LFLILIIEEDAPFDMGARGRLKLIFSSLLDGFTLTPYNIRIGN
jgi:hypothetical protein